MGMRARHRVYLFGRVILYIIVSLPPCYNVSG